MGFLLNNDGENDFLLADTYSKDDIFWITLRGLISKGKINEAEDMLFKEAEKNPSMEIYEIGERMYSLLANKSEEELKKYNGENGRLAYVAIEGIVYDITNLSGLELFNGTNLRLGSDITKEFKTYYRGDKELLKDAKEVAILHDFNESQRGKHIEHNLKELTLNELSKYNGEKGKPPYISIFDTIYDLS